MRSEHRTKGNEGVVKCISEEKCARQREELDRSLVCSGPLIMGPRERWEGQENVPEK